MWVNASTFVPISLASLGGNSRKEELFAMWMFQHWASLALALDWVVIRHQIFSKGEILWKAVFGNQAMENEVLFLSAKFDCWESIWCLMKQEKYFLPREIRMLTGYYFEYFNILADTSVPRRYKLLFVIIWQVMEEDWWRVFQRRIVLKHDLNGAPGFINFN